MRNPERVWKLVGQCRGAGSDFYVVHCWPFLRTVCGLEYNFLDYSCLLTCGRGRLVRETISSEILSPPGEVGFGGSVTPPGPIQCHLGPTVIVLSPSSDPPPLSSALMFFVISHPPAGLVGMVQYSPQVVSMWPMRGLTVYTLFVIVWLPFVRAYRCPMGAKLPGDRMSKMLAIRIAVHDCGLYIRYSRQECNYNINLELQPALQSGRRPYCTACGNSQWAFQLFWYFGVAGSSPLHYTTSLLAVCVASKMTAKSACLACR